MIGFAALLVSGGRRYADNLHRLTPAMVARPAVLLPLFTAFAGELAFRGIDWHWLQLAMRHLVVGGMNMVGEEAVSQGSVRYSVASVTFAMTARCTYADFLCFTTPLVLGSRSLTGNARLVVIWWTSILVACVARICLAHLLNGTGLTWFLAHDAVDYGLRSLAMLAVIGYWLDASLRPCNTAGKPG